MNIKVFFLSISRLVIVGVLLLSCRNSFAQEAPIYKWAFKIVNRVCYAGDNSASLTTSDAAGNVYVLGAFCDPFDADPGSGVFTVTADNSGYTDIFLVKHGPNGNFLWATRFAEAPYFNFPSALVVDANGNVFTATHYEIGFSDFRTIISKFDASGNPVWSNRIYTAKGRAHAIILDATGNPILTGDFSSTVDFDPGAGVQSVTASGSETDFFVLKLDSDGNFLWVKTGGGASFDRGISLARDASNNIVVGGYYFGTTDLDPGVAVSNFTSLGDTDAFVLKLDNAGNFVWAKSMGGTQSDVPTSIVVNSSNTIFLTGYFTGSGDFDPNAGVATLTSSSPTKSDIFLMRLNADGSFGWASAFGGSDDDEGRGLTTDAAGNIIFTGFFNGTVDFDPGAGVRNLISIGQNSYQNMFISKLDQNQQLVWAQEIASTTSTSSRVRAYTISIDGAGDISLGGSLWGGADFDFGICNRSLSNNPPVGFAMKIKTGGVSGPPAITSFTPTAGSVGTTVVITGTNFSSVPAENDVRWSPNSAAVVTASTPTSITAIVPSGAASGKLYVTVSCYPIAISANNFTIGSPVLPTIISFTPTSGSVGTSVTITGTNFSTTPVNNTVRFNGTAAVVTASTATSITTTVPTGATTGTITVTVAGNTATSATNFTVTAGAVIAINPQPTSTAICDGAIASFTLSASGTTNLTYQWQKFNGTAFVNISNGAGYSGTTTSTLTINTIGNFGAGDYRCSVSGDLATSVFSQTASLTFTTNTTLAEITINGNIMTASTGDSYQWYQNGDMVVDATEQSFEFNSLQYGLYTVDVTENGCTSTSLPFEYLITGLENFNGGIKLYPNPVEENLSLEYRPPYMICVVDVTGKVVYQVTVNTESTSIDLSSLSKGLYLLQLKNDQGQRSLRITKK